MLVANHGPFAWGPTRRRRSRTRACSSIWRGSSGACGRWHQSAAPPDAFLVDKHYRRKHGPEGLLRPEVSAAQRSCGTWRQLVDSGDYHWRAWRDTMRDEGVELTYQQFLDSFGQKNDRILEDGSARDPAEVVHRVGDTKEALYRDLRAEGSSRCRAPPVGRRLRHEGWRQAIASSAPRQTSASCCDRGPGGPVRRHRFRRGRHRREARPAGIPRRRRKLRPLRMLHCRRRRAAGIEAARRAGMQCIGVNTSTVLDADVFVRSLANLPPDAFERLLSTPNAKLHPPSPGSREGRTPKAP